jgi:hypothetical protein
MTAETVNNITELIISDDILCSEIVENLKTNTSVRELILGFQKIETKNIKLIIKNLNEFKSIKKLMVLFNNNEEEIILNKLKYNNNIEILEISNSSDINLPKKLASLLKINTSIKSLVFSFFSINIFNDLKYLYDEINRNTNIKSLDVQLNNLSINSLKKIRHTIHLNTLFITQDIAENFISLIKENKYLIISKVNFIRIDNNYIKYTEQTKYYLDRNKAEYAARILKFNIYQFKFLGKIPWYIFKMINTN